MTKQMTAAAIDEMMLPELRTLAAQHFDAADIKGLRKAQLIELLKENLDSINGADDELDDEVDDDELDDELDDEADDEDEELDETPAIVKAVDKALATPAAKATPPEPTGDTLTAKQVATRIGTDAKTLRKFFRSPASTVEPCGQGGRYEFAKEDMAKIKAEFEKWNSTKGTRTPKAESAPKSTSRADRAPATAVVEEDEELDIDDEDPTADELDELDDLELDDDELDD